MTQILQSFIDTYGYFALLIGTFFEGETILVLGGLAAQLGYLELPWVIVIAFIGALSGDQLWFIVGRCYGQTLLARFPRLRVRVERVHEVLERYETPVLLGFRFVYGFRNLTPFVVGTGRIKALKFVMLNAIGALVWSVTIACTGYVFGEVMEIVLGDIKRYQLWAIGVVVATGLTLWAIHIVRSRRRERAAKRAN